MQLRNTSQSLASLRLQTEVVWQYLICQIGDSKLNLEKENYRNPFVVFQLLTPTQARKIHLQMWSSEDDQDSKTGRPQEFLIVLKYLVYADQ